MNQIPVTVLTDYLGAGKTTLLNRILTEEHGKKYAVVVNEFGEIGIDNDLVVNADEEVFEMNNGCICCTVRGDLIRILGGLMKRQGGFDGILIETTSLADPAPVAQTFFVDEDVRRRTWLDSIVTVVDALHPAPPEGGSEALLFTSAQQEVRAWRLASEDGEARLYVVSEGKKKAENAILGLRRNRFADLGAGHHAPAAGRRHVDRQPPGHVPSRRGCRNFLGGGC